MKKLKLDVEALSVQTFETEPQEKERGTVQAHDTYISDACEGCGEPSIDYYVDTCGIACYTNCGSGCYTRCCPTLNFNPSCPPYCA